MKSIVWILSILGALGGIVAEAAAREPENASLLALKTAVVANYSWLMQAEYEDSVTLARRMQTNIEIFLARPGTENLKAAQTAWIQCRTPYSQSEVGRFYDGPIDGVEGFVNAWPIDENYLDYTAGMPGSGIINEVKTFPVITRDVLLGANEREGEKTVSTGFHAIEFLLWGQDFYADSAGRRLYTDYVDSREGPGLTAGRRRLYLHLLAGLLVDQLAAVSAQWAHGNPHNYCARLLSLPPDEALANIFTGVGNLGNAELYGERLLVPYTTQSQENEESCFSDTTHLDLLNNELGVQNICLGHYQRINGTQLNGPGIISLLETADPPLASRLNKQIAAAVTALGAIPPPFDQAILGGKKSPGRLAIKKALDALQAQTGSLVKAGQVLNVHFNLK